VALNQFVVSEQRVGALQTSAKSNAESVGKLRFSEDSRTGWLSRRSSMISGSPLNSRPKPACYHRSLGVRSARVRILFIGDIFGRAGRTIVKDRLPGLVREHAIDLVIANGENSAAGFGITPPLAEDLFELGIDVVTTCNHVWDKREIVDYFQMADGNLHSMARRLLRPANYHSDLPGWGVYEGTKKDVPYAVINLQGRVFMAANDDPFRVADPLLNQLKAKIVFVDIHAEATSEKISMGWYLDGRV